MVSEMNTFQHDLFQDILQKSDAEGKLQSESFFEIYSDEMMETGEIPEAHHSHKVGTGFRVDGYGGDPIYSPDQTLSLLVSEFDQSGEAATLTRTQLDTCFRRLSGFVDRSLNDDFRQSMEETDPAFGLANTIATRWESISRIRMFLISNKVLSSRVDRIDGSEIRDKPVSHSVWDLTRIHQVMTSVEARDEMNIDLLNDFGGAITALPAHLMEADYEAYVAVLPANQLVKLYDTWGDRLLEQNVRVFLQSRSKVNRGIRNTLQNIPQMFFAYNNGISATAEHVETRQGIDGLEITSLRNLQIVNGGQTTGSIYRASREKRHPIDLSNVFVQMKLSVIEPAMVDEVVPNISRFSNSQNSVNESDFFSNSPFHLRIEEFSRRIYAPSHEGEMRQSKWFYERARGQHQQNRARMNTAAETRAFDIAFPKHQKFVKTDLAKFLNVWREKPDVVSKGAQKNFADFAVYVDHEWENSPNQFNETYFHEAIAKAIIFKGTEKIVGSQPWYETGGYRAPIVAYTIAKLAYDVRQIQNAVDFNVVWLSQKMTPALTEALDVSSTAVKDIILNPGKTGYQNITEWAKQQACWSRVSSLNVEWPESLPDCLISRDELNQNQRVARRDQRVLNGITAQIAVANASPEFWLEMKAYGSERGLLSGNDLGLINSASSISSTGRMLSERQCDALLELYERLIEEGFPGDIEG